MSSEPVAGCLMSLMAVAGAVDAGSGPSEGLTVMNLEGYGSLAGNKLV